MTWHPHLSLEVAAEFAAVNDAGARTDAAVEAWSRHRVEGSRMAARAWKERNQVHVREASRERWRKQRAAMLPPLPEPPRTYYRYSSTPLEERCTGITIQGYQCALARVDCRIDHGGRSVENAFTEYREGLKKKVAAGDAEGLEAEAVRLRGGGDPAQSYSDLMRCDAAYGLHREAGTEPSGELLAESQRLRTMLRLVENAIGRLRKTKSYGVSPSEWPEEGEEEADAAVEGE